MASITKLPLWYAPKKQSRKTANEDDHESYPSDSEVERSESVEQDQDYFDRVLQLKEVAIETSYTFDYMRYCSIQTIISNVYEIFNDPNKNSFVQSDLNGHDLTLYRTLIRTILDRDDDDIQTKHIMNLHSNLR
jgi:hypothetical protein